MRIIMLGAPGAGKGTQAKKIAEKYQVPHISTGDIFRANIKNNTALGKKAKEFIDEGHLVPDDLTVELIVSRLLEADCDNGYILDGFPRTIPQAHSFDQILADHHKKLDYVIDIEVPDQVIIDRMAGRRACKECGSTFHLQFMPPKQEGICDICGGTLILRKDDDPETVKERLHVYHEQTQPLKDYYSESDILVVADGMDDIKEVFKHITFILDHEEEQKINEEE